MSIQFWKCLYSIFTIFHSTEIRDLFSKKKAFLDRSIASRLDQLLLLLCSFHEPKHISEQAQTPLICIKPIGAPHWTPIELPWNCHEIRVSYGQTCQISAAPFDVTTSPAAVASFPAASPRHSWFDPPPPLAMDSTVGGFREGVDDVDVDFSGDLLRLEIQEHQLKVWCGFSKDIP